MGMRRSTYEKDERELTDLFLDPATVAVLTSLVNLEPLGGPRIEFVTRCVPARGHVGYHRAWEREQND